MDLPVHFTIQSIDSLFMKAKLPLIFICLILASAKATEPISVEEFKKTADYMKRQELIEKAPPEQQDQLRKIDEHILLANSWGGEAALQHRKESDAARARGLRRMEAAFTSYSATWVQYIAGVMFANKKTDMSVDRQVQILKDLDEEKATHVNNRFSLVHSLVVNMAPSPEALALEKKMEEYEEQLREQYEIEGRKGDKPFITKEQREAVDRQFDEFLEAMEKMPKLSPEKVQKEVDEVPEERIPIPFQH